MSTVGEISTIVEEGPESVTEPKRSKLGFIFNVFDLLVLFLGLSSITVLGVIFLTLSFVFVIIMVIVVGALVLIGLGLTALPLLGFISSLRLVSFMRENSMSKSILKFLENR